MTTIQNTIKEFAKLQGTKFVSVTYLSKGKKELARHTLLVGVDLNKVYKRDLALYKRLLKKTYELTWEYVALSELIQSLSESLSLGIGNNSRYTNKGAYENVLPGIKLHVESNQWHLYCLGVSKVKICQSCKHEQVHGKTCDNCKAKLGEYKEVKSSEKTLVKNHFKTRGKLAGFCQFSLEEKNLQSVRLNGKTLEIV
jgi:hypothetical protein